MDRKPKHFLYFFSGTALLFLVWLFLINPLIDDINELRREKVLIEKENYELEQRLSNIYEVESEWEKWSGRLGESKKIIPPASILSDVFGELEKIFSEMPVNITGVSTGKMENMAEEQHFASVIFNVTAKGTAFDKDNDLINFLEKLENFPYLLVVDNFTMQYGEEIVEEDGTGNHPEVFPGINLSFTLFINKTGDGSLHVTPQE